MRKSVVVLLIYLCWCCGCGGGSGGQGRSGNGNGNGNGNGSSSSTPSTPNEWTWLGGSSTGGEPGAYGALGTPAAGNVPGGRGVANSWTSSGGNYWLFGGWGLDSTGNEGYLNDLWEFNASHREWTWMGGSSTAAQPGVYGTLGTPAAGNVPGARCDAGSWTDSSGNLWLFGGNIYFPPTGGELNDLWEFNPSTREWAWIGGSTTGNQAGVPGTLGVLAAGNFPGARYGETTWTDHSGNFWFFGGQGYGSNPGCGCEGWLNDLWEFNPSTRQWGWMGGNPMLNIGYAPQPGVYGTLGAPAAGNIPGGRKDAAGWTDRSGNLWLFGGSGYDSTGEMGSLNDLWEFSPSTGEWTWMSGSSTENQTGVYGTLATPAAGNVPGARARASSWTDSSGNLWLFGGNGSDSTGAIGYLNDLWEFSPSTREWGWMGGSTTVGSGGGQPGVYGTLGTPASGNIPAGRSGANSWIDSSGNFWLFGGGSNAPGNSGLLNDLWEYQFLGTANAARVSPTK